MKKIIEIMMVFALVASLNAVEDASKKSVQKADVQKEGVHQQAGHICINSIFMQAGQLEKQGKNEEALKMLLDSKGKPEYESHSLDIYTKIQKIYDKTKQYDKNIALWEEGHKKGLIFGIDPKSDEFKPYTKLKNFSAVAKKDYMMKVQQAKNPDVKAVKEENCNDLKKEVKAVKPAVTR